jgi:hypothetical protein
MLAHRLLEGLVGRRLPELEHVAAAGEQHRIGQVGMLEQGLRQDDPALAVERDHDEFAEKGLHREVFVGELGQRLQLLAHPVGAIDPARLDHGEAVGGDGGDPVETLGGEQGAIGGRHRHPPFGIDPIDVDAAERRIHLLPQRMPPATQPPLVGTIDDGAWDIMGIYGKCRDVNGPQVISRVSTPRPSLVGASRQHR